MRITITAVVEINPENMSEVEAMELCENTVNQALATTSVVEDVELVEAEA